MIRVVLDANLFVSAILKPQSNPGKIFDLIERGKIALLVSASILLEIRSVLLYPKLQKLHHYIPRQIDFLLKELTKFAQFTTTEKLKIDAIKADPTDNKYLECAIAGNADFIISGDHHLKDLKTFQGIRIVSPAEFFELIK